MKSIKKAASILLAAALLASTAAVAVSFSANAESTDAPAYVQKFSKDNFLGTIEYEEGGPNSAANVKATLDSANQNVTFNNDGSFTMNTSYKKLGLRAVFSIDDSMKKSFAAAAVNGEAIYQKNLEAAKKKAEDAGKVFDPTTVAKVLPSLNYQYRIEKSVTKKGIMADAFVYYGFIKDDGTLMPVSKGGGQMYQTVTGSYPMGYKSFDSSADNLSSDPATEIKNFDGIKAIYIEIYHYNAYDKSITFGGLTTSGTPEIPAFPEVKPADKDNDGKIDTQATLYKWDSSYKKDWGNPPDKIMYSPDNVVAYNKRGDAGYVQYSCDGPSQQKQLAYSFNRDDMNYGIAVANQEGASHTALVTITLNSCVDQDNKPVKAEVCLNMYTFNNKVAASVVRAWQNPGSSTTYEIDTSKYDLNSINYIELNVQNYWYYDANGKIVEHRQKKDGDPDVDENGKKIEYGTGVKGISINPVVTVSPITVKQVGEKITTATIKVTTATQKATSATMEGVGYHFFDYADDCRLKQYGNAPQSVAYLADKTSNFYGGVNLKSPTKVNKQHQAYWSLVSAKSTNDQGQTIEEVIPSAVKNRIYNQMKQALAYANAPGASGQLKFTANVISGKHTATKKDCSLECQIRIACKDSMDDVVKGGYVNVGKSTTFFMNVSELTADKISGVHVMAQNYANTDPKTGNACGCTNIDVNFSAISVAGPEAPTTIPITANTSEADAIYELYKQLPGMNASDYTTTAQFALLEKFLNAMDNANEATIKYLESKYHMNYDDTYGVLKQVYLEALGGEDASPLTGATAAPIAAMLVACAAGFVIIKSRKAK